MAGRPVGAIGRSNLTARELCKKLKFDPFAELIALKDQLFTKLDADGKAVQIGCTPELKAKIMIDLLPYLYPKLSSVEVTGYGGGPLELRTEIKDLRPSDVMVLAAAIEKRNAKKG